MFAELLQSSNITAAEADSVVLSHFTCVRKVRLFSVLQTYKLITDIFNCACKDQYMTNRRCLDKDF